MSETKPKPHTVPIAQNQGNQCTITPQWFVDNTEYHPVPATFLPLVNGDKAFGKVYEAIEKATKSVDIICWGFQPSMYFVRDGKSLTIGSLLAKKAKEGVKVKILCWTDSLHLTAKFSENMTPGRSTLAGKVETQSDAQYEADVKWYLKHDPVHVLEGTPTPSVVLDKIWHNDAFHGLIDNIHFATRDFSLWERSEIAYRQALHSVDANRSKAMTTFAMSAEPTHHQKMVLVDYEVPDKAVGFVMGHNMLDEYWDTKDHSVQRFAPNRGRNGKLPRQDISSRVTGPILEHLNLNFCKAWKKETGEDLLGKRKAASTKLHEAVLIKQLHKDIGTPVMAQILRTQSQANVRNIEKLYLQAVNNATSFIYIENQYFRWPPLAEAIKKAAQTQIKCGRDPGKHGPLHLFVVTNSSDEGMGDGTVNTHRMLKSLGREDTIPGIERSERKDALNKQLSHDQFDEILANRETQQNPNAANQTKSQQAHAKTEATKAEIKKADHSVIAPQDIPGLKVHVCTLVAPDSPPANWVPVYVHAKLMVVNDVFMTLGSANINTRSMEVDSELNICHEMKAVTQPLRQELWGIHTKGMGAQDDPAEAFRRWGDIMKRNKDNASNHKAPYASLVEFSRESPKRTNKD